MDQHGLETTGRLDHHVNHRRRRTNQWYPMGRTVWQRHPHWQTTLEGSPTTDSATEVPLRSTKTENYGSSPPKAFFLIEPQTGKVLQQKELSANLDVTSTPLVTEHEIIFGSADRGVFALDKPTLFIKWRAETLPSLVYTAPYSSTPQAAVETSPVSSQGMVYIGAFRRVFIRHRPVNRDYQRQVVFRSTCFLHSSSIGKQDDCLRLCG